MLDKVSRRAGGLAPFFVLALILTYFAGQAWTGENGLQSSMDYKRQIAELEADIALMSAERAQWEDRATRLREASLDLDYLDERARALTGMADRRDVIIPSLD